MKILRAWRSVIVVLSLVAVGLTGCSGDDATAPTAAKPAAPTGVIAAAGDGQATISWTAEPGAKSYNVYWSTTAGVTKVSGARITGAASPYTHAGLTNGTTCYYVVTAVNGAGESAPSYEVSATPAPPAPTAPTGVSATPGNTDVTIAWTEVAGATSYNIYWGVVTPASFGTVTGAANPYVHIGLTNGTRYYYAVTAVNASGESAASFQVSAIPKIEPAPAAPTDITATPGDGQVTIAWTTVPGATKYNIYRAVAPGVTTVTGTKITALATPYTQTGLINGTTYYFVVTAEGQGESTESYEVSATPSVAP